MKSELENTNWLYQETVVYKIKELFGDTFVYLNANGNLSIDKKVLAKFRKLTNDTVIWEFLRRFCSAQLTDNGSQFCTGD
ncbi:DUF6953 family protein [Escherichia coli]|uniref:DUF6953 family protein n=1 Tax=Escherichia coli TaxID=562 RepID=UPI0039C978D9